MFKSIFTLAKVRLHRVCCVSKYHHLTFVPGDRGRSIIHISPDDIVARGSSDEVDGKIRPPLKYVVQLLLNRIWGALATSFSSVESIPNSLKLNNNTKLNIKFKLYFYFFLKPFFLVLLLLKYMWGYKLSIAYNFDRRKLYIKTIFVQLSSSRLGGTYTYKFNMINNYTRNYVVFWNKNLTHLNYLSVKLLVFGPCWLQEC